MLITQNPALIWENRRGVGLVGVDGFWDNGGMGAFANCKSPMRIGMFWFQTIGVIPWLRRRALADLRITKVVIKLSVRKFQSVLRLVGMTEISGTLPPSFSTGTAGAFFVTDGQDLGSILDTEPSPVLCFYPFILIL